MLVSEFTHCEILCVRMVKLKVLPATRKSRAQMTIMNGGKNIRNNRKRSKLWRNNQSFMN